MNYQHTPLSTLRSFRILYLEPHHGNASAGVKCRIEECSLDVPPSYTALSYAWDSQTATFSIDCGLRTLKITPNCERALYAARKEDTSISMWIDSICIDQNSLNERSQQVALMGSIYQQAEYVMVWLGGRGLSVQLHSCS